jgi:hypothetical protein
MTPRFFGACLLLAAGSVAAQDEGLRHCRSLTDAAERLACYDGLPLKAAAAAVPAPQAATPAAPPKPAAAIAVVPVPPVTSAATAVAAMAPAPTAATAPAAPATSNFGLEAPRDEAAQVSSHIAGRFEGWGPRSRIKLANGQVWQVSDDSSAVYDLLDPRVTVRRAALGSFMMEIDGARRAPRVRRLE